MEEKARIVVYSERALEDLNSIYNYGVDTFSPHSAEAFIQELLEKTDDLASSYLYHTECRDMPTKSKKYRMMVFYSYNIIYRITKLRIEVLMIMHSSQSINTMKRARTIKI